MKSVVLGGGCFWCIEAIYQQISGVESVESGYAGGDTPNPTYEKHGNHAEVILLNYNENEISLDTILEIFFYVHDPTTLNQQGNDIGTQYRSIILCGESEVENAENAKVRAGELWDKPVVTEVKVLNKFYKAEDYHQNYYNQNQTNPYCQIVINPKLSKFQSKFANYLKH